MGGRHIMKFSKGIFVNIQDTISSDYTVEQCILVTYESALLSLKHQYQDKVLDIICDKNNNYDVDVCAYADIRNNQEIVRYPSDFRVFVFLTSD